MDVTLFVGMGRKWAICSALALALVLAGGAVALWRVRSRPAQAPAPAKSQSAPAPPPTGIIVLAGKVEPQAVVHVGAQITGNVEQFMADVGQEVAEGQVLARISNLGLETAREVATTALDNAQARVSKLEAALLSARLELSRADADASRTRSELERTEKAYQRQRMLFREGATPRLALEKTTREYEAAQSDHSGADALAKQAREHISAMQEQVDAARKILADKTKQLEDAQASILAGEVKSPVDGVVVGRRGEVGKPAQEAGDRLFDIATEPSLLQVPIEPEPPVLQRVRAGMPAIVVVPELQTDAIAAEVKEIRGTVVLVAFTSPNANIKPGMPAEVRLKLD